MQESVNALDELDLALINALQIRPRAAWSELSGVLGVDAGTLARRWARLTESGAAWVTCYPGPASSGSLAYIEVRAEPRSIDAVAAEIAKDPYAMTVERLTGSCDLLLTAAAFDASVFSRYVTRRLSHIPGVTGIQTRLVTRLYSEGSRWRLRSLEPAQNRALSDVPQTKQRRPPALEDVSLLLALGEDGRMSYADLAERTGLSPATVRRRVNRLLSAGGAVLRCEVAHALSGWPVGASLWAQVPAVELDEVARWAMTLPEMRSCAAIMGPANLVMFLWLRTAEDMIRLETEMTRKYPSLVVVDRAVTLDMTKLMGRMVDQAGRCAGNVPMDLWSDVVGQSSTSPAAIRSGVSAANRSW